MSAHSFFVTMTCARRWARKSLVALLVSTSIPLAAQENQSPSLELVREHLVFPRPALLNIPAKLLKTDASWKFEKLVRALENLKLVEIKEDASGLSFAATALGQDALVPILNLANYEVSSWKLKLGVQDVIQEDQAALDPPSAEHIRGRKVLLEKADYYESVWPHVPDSERDLFAEKICVWNVADIQNVDEKCER
jgi:hypothetical protein